MLFPISETIIPELEILEFKEVWKKINSLLSSVEFSAERKIAERFDNYAK